MVIQFTFEFTDKILHIYTENQSIQTNLFHFGNMIQMCSGIASGRVLNGELYAQILQKLTYLHLLTGCFMKISLQSSKQKLVANAVI